MRKAFVNTLIELARKDKNVFLLNGDLGFSVLEEFIEKFPNQYANCGVAEQNMMAMAAGLAMEGKKVYVYSIVPFATFRCFEQIRDDIAYHNANVKIIGVGAGFYYGPVGVTHYAIEDIAVVNALPNMRIFCPADPAETRELMLQSYKDAFPAYIRIDKGSVPLYDNSNVVIGRPSVLQEGKDGVVIATGTILTEAIDAVKKLEEKGCHFKLISLHTLKPVDEKLLVKEIIAAKVIVTLEEHRLPGGLGSIVNNILIKHRIQNARVENMGVSAEYTFMIGSQKYLREQYKIDAQSIFNNIIKMLKNGK